MNNALVVGFGHRKRTGKDTASNMLLTHLAALAPDVTVEKVSFAKKLKAVSYDMFGWAGLQPGDFYELDENAHLREVVLPLVGKTPRQIWIEVGNKMREVYADIWVRNALLGPKAQIIVLSDLRYHNEAGIIEELGGFRYKLNRPGVPISNDVADVNLDNYTNWSEVIQNDGELAELSDKVLVIARTVLDELERRNASSRRPAIHLV